MLSGPHIYLLYYSFNPDKKTNKPQYYPDWCWSLPSPPSRRFHSPQALLPATQACMRDATSQSRNVQCICSNCKMYFLKLSLDLEIQLLECAPLLVTKIHPDHFSSHCIYQARPTGFLQSFWQYFWPTDFNISCKLLYFLSFLPEYAVN